MLKKCMGDTSLIIPIEDISIKDSLSYEEIPVQILDRQVCKLRTKEVASVKVLWRNQFIGEATWEAEDDMKKKYPHLFETGEVLDQGCVIVHNGSESSFVSDAKAKQGLDPILVELKKVVLTNSIEAFY
ncbi:hypothetical protein MTR67_051388 [Solanum verrucosum]|uniref:Chromo domain-containing protein n=1 Tax=Solanum verrucosum TaxID=315347 RepID=A0AAF0V790_SOLVR|nr:hypothetical protein MTR67_051388 [Solanum verrucosum]